MESDGAYSECRETFDRIWNECASTERRRRHILSYISRIPHVLNTLESTEEERLKRNEALDKALQRFVLRFVGSKGYSSCPDHAIVSYDGISFSVVPEDYLVKDALEALNGENLLRQWKFRAKNAVVKAIKEHSVLTVLPTSETVQRCLTWLTGRYFPTKDDAKYFLAALGEQLVGPRSENVFCSSSNRS